MRSFFCALLIVACDNSVFTQELRKSQTNADTKIDSDSSIECPPATTPCEKTCCSDGFVCRYGMCLLPPEICVDSNNCQNDTCCAEMECLPWGLGPCGAFDPTCTNPIEVGAFNPEVQCSWTTPLDTSNGTAFYDQMIAPLVVVDFNFDEDSSTIAPSIVFPAYAGTDWSDAVLRVIDGATCVEQYAMTDPENRINGAGSIAVGDLDLDGRAEIVAPHASGGLVAFQYDRDTDTFVVFWRSHDAIGTWATHMSGLFGGAPSIHDLDADGAPEVILGAVVHDADGEVLSETLGVHVYSFSGQIPVLADVDLDGLIELVYGDGIWEFDPILLDFVPESYFVAEGADGFTAIADFGDFGDGPGMPEVAVISNGEAQVQRITGEVVFGPVTLPCTVAGQCRGGPPTVADFDGDGEHEFATATGSHYIVLDLPCAGDPPPVGCAAPGVRWAQPSQDLSSNITGSSVFDFDGDGAAEAVYADECYTRIYDGATGTVKFSAARSSGTGYEYPIIADVDGDFNSEIVVGLNDGYHFECPSMDPLFAGDPCTEDSDCSVAHRCDGVNCRAFFEDAHGIRVYRDARDLWVNSRPIWNQHAYAVTNVYDDGTIPSSSDWEPNWLTDGLNNFRQNILGIGEATDAPDLTVAFEGGWSCLGKEGALLSARVCNRGTQPVGPGIPATFRRGDEVVCIEETEGPLEPGTCEIVECSWQKPLDMATDVELQVDDSGKGSGENRECREGNNRAVIQSVACDGPE